MPKRSEAEWRELLNDFHQSGLSQKAFCRQKKICAKRLGRYRREAGLVSTQTPFVQVTPPKPTSDDTIKVELGGLTLYLPLTQPLQAAQLIKALL